MTDVKINVLIDGKVETIEVKYLDSLIAEAEHNRDKFYKAASYYGFGSDNATKYGAMWARRAIAYQTAKNGLAR